MDMGLNPDAPPVVHGGDCWNAGKLSRGIGQHDALRALAEGVRAYIHCRPDTTLGVLE
jgi:hypothetical protein